MTGYRTQEKGSDAFERRRVYRGPGEGGEVKHSTRWYTPFEQHTKEHQNERRRACPRGLLLALPLPAKGRDMFTVRREISGLLNLSRVHLCACAALVMSARPWRVQAGILRLRRVGRRSTQRRSGLVSAASRATRLSIGDGAEAREGQGNAKARVAGIRIRIGVVVIADMTLCFLQVVASSGGQQGGRRQ